MRIVIVGAGKLGYSIAQLLAEDQYDVVVVEIDEKRREVVKNSLDVLTIGGNGVLIHWTIRISETPMC